MCPLREELRSRLRYFGGHSDTLGLFADAGFLRLQRHVVEPGDRVLIVDDWAETGSKAMTTRSLVEMCGGRYVGLSLLVDQLPDRARDELEPVRRIAFAHEVEA